MVTFGDLAGDTGSTTPPHVILHICAYYCTLKEQITLGS